MPAVRRPRAPHLCAPQVRPPSPLSAPSACTLTPPRPRSSVPPPSSHQLALASMSAPVRPPPPSGSSTRAPKPATITSTSSPAAHTHTHTHTHTPSPPAPSHESRRRNAAQRAAQLRADPLLAAVEPARVFCTLCRKWVQLRQDSSFCAYPWQQHRAKCLLRQYVPALPVAPLLRVPSTCADACSPPAPHAQPAQGSRRGRPHAPLRHRHRRPRRQRGRQRQQRRLARLGAGCGRLRLGGRRRRRHVARGRG